MIEAITNSGIKYDEGDEVVNVCQAIQEMRKESEQKKAMEVAEKLHEMGLDTEKSFRDSIRVLRESIRVSVFVWSFACL